MKRSQLVGRALGPDTLVVLVGRFRSAATWAANEGLHLSQWTLVESCSPLIIFDRRFTHAPNKEAHGTVPSAPATFERDARHHRFRWWLASHRVDAKRNQA